MDPMAAAVLDASDCWTNHPLLKLVENYGNEESLNVLAIKELETRKLASEVEAALADLERLKETRITAGKEARELRFKLETSDATVNFKQAKLSSQQQEISETKALVRKLQAYTQFS